MENFYPKDYASAIKLALNGFIDDIIIHDFGYNEDNDVWIVDATDSEWGRIRNITLYGSLVRSCYKAVQQGITKWT